MKSAEHVPVVPMTPAADSDRADARGDRRAETPVASSAPAWESASRLGANRMGGPAAVVKLGGRSLEAPGALRAFAAELARLSRATLVVHGGGAEVSAWSERLGIAPRFEAGLRVTDAPTLDVAVAVLAGLANKRLVAALRAAGIDAVGLAALDGGTLAVEPHERSAMLGAVGRVCGADPSLLQSLLAAGRTPVVASIGAHAGALLNLNADDAAAALAGALGASALVLLSDAPGVRLGGTVAPALSIAGVDAALAGPDVDGGMRPKLLAARAAIAAGVASVRIAAWSGPGSLAELLSDRGPGTRITAGEPTASEASHV